MPPARTSPLFLAALVVDGVLSGALYALVALAFVVVYKASRMINFALGEWVMVAGRLVAAGGHVLGLPLGGALAVGAVGMVALAFGVSRAVLSRLVGRPLISLIMITIGLGALMRGAVAVGLAGVPGGIALPLPREPLDVLGLPVAADKAVAAAVAGLGIAGVAWFFRASRTGIALRAVADDQQAALAVGIDVDRHFAITWGLMAGLCVLAGTLWTAVSGAGFSVTVLGLKVFPIVVLGGLDSIGGTIVGGLAIGVLESLAAGYLDPLVGTSVSTVVSSVVLVLALCLRPQGLLGGPAVERV